MRLLNARTKEIEEYVGNGIPKYAILSHCWGQGEVSFQDINTPHWRGMPGSDKIEYACDQAIRDRIGYVWVDNCCIDKCSSAELSEAINSMYTWYHMAIVCYAYLEDVTATNNSTAFDSEFRKSRWFTRGWTLQELLAPTKVLFFGRNWVTIGEKIKLASLISVITKIQEKVLYDPELISEMSVARRMSWAARRETTRIEDMAYSLLGIFAVNMPLLYGEGKKAFMRLQEAIITESCDQSIFVWDILPPAESSGILATSPSDFMFSGDIAPYSSPPDMQPYSMTNRGLQIELSLCTQYDYPNVSLALLDCQIDMNYSIRLGIFLVKTTNSNVYKRIVLPKSSSSLLYLTKKELRAWTDPMLSLIYISKSGCGRTTPDFDIFEITSNYLFNLERMVKRVTPQSIEWDPMTKVLKKPSSQPWAALRLCSTELSFDFYLILIKTKYNDQGFVEILDKLLGEATERDLNRRFGQGYPLSVPEVSKSRAILRDLRKNDHGDIYRLKIDAAIKEEEKMNRKIFVVKVDGRYLKESELDL